MVRGNLEFPRGVIRDGISESKDCDVLICGGGSAGIAAGLAAARNQARTLLIESQNCVGGVATSGLLGRFGPFHDQKDIILGGIPWEVLERLVDMGAAKFPKCGPRKDKENYWLPYDPEALKYALDRMAEDSGLEIWYGASVVTPWMEGDAVRGALVLGRNGLVAVKAGVVIDASGDGLFSSQAGAEITKGREKDGLMQPVGLKHMIFGFDSDAAKAYISEHRSELKQLVKGLHEQGSDILPVCPLVSDDRFRRKDLVNYNADHVLKVDMTDNEAYSRAMVRSRRLAWSAYHNLKTHVPDCDRAQFFTASQIGVRETRQVVGEYVFTGEDVAAARQFPDQIGRYACYVDIHPVDENGRGEMYGLEPEPGTSYGLPWRSLLPKKIDNLLVAGRCFSATHQGMASARMVPCCMAMGQAAGTAAAMCSREGSAPRHLDVDRLRETLARQGVIL